MLALYMSLLDDPEDQRKFERLYMKYKQTMYYVARDVLNNEHDAEDAVQQAFIRIMNHLDDIDENDIHRTRSYMTVVAQHIAIDIYRRKRREWAHNISYDEHEIFIEDPKGQDFENIKDDTTAKRLAEAIEKLPPKYAEVIRLTYVQGFGSEKVGEILNLTPENVRQRLVRGRKKLAELLGGKYDDYC